MRMNFQKSIGTSKGYTFIIVDDRLCLLYQYDFGDENNPIMLVQVIPEDLNEYFCTLLKELPSV